MDCPSEENLIRMQLGDIPQVHHLAFDLPNRTLVVFHDGGMEALEHSIKALNLGGHRLTTEKSAQTTFVNDAQEQKQLLGIVLAINLAFFFIEMLTGLVAQSMGLVADSLDMLADALVYGISLWAVGKSVVQKKQVARLAGYFQVLLAIVGFTEVIRRFWVGEILPNPTTMVVVSTLALMANALCLYLLQKSSNKEEAHMRASVIFTSNDVIINVGVMVAGLLVYALQSNIPDLVIGTLVFVLVIRGARSILQLGK